MEINEFGEYGWQIQHVKGGDSLDLPIDEVELSISPFVDGASFQSEVVRVNIDLHGPSDCGNSHVDSNAAAVRKNQSLLRFHWHPPLQKAVEHLELRMRFCCGAPVSSDQGSGKRDRARSSRGAELLRHRGKGFHRGVLPLQHLLDDGREVGNGEIAGEVEREALERGDTNAVVKSASVIIWSDRGLAKLDEIWTVESSTVWHAENNFGRRRHPPHVRKSTACRSSNEPCRMLQAKDNDARLEGQGHPWNAIHAMANGCQHAVVEQAGALTDGDTGRVQLSCGNCAELAIEHDECRCGEYGHSDLHDQA